MSILKLSLLAIVVAPLFLAPVAALVALGAIVTVMQTAFACLPWIAGRLGKIHHETTIATKPVRLAIHVPTHNEPPHIVIATLTSLRDQIGAPHYEVIVLDNNTIDATLWQPVRDWCAAQDGPFRFFHHEGVEGAKAGGLNIALSVTDEACTHVVVVDADYVVCRDFLRTVMTALTVTGADYLQFPQAFEGGDAKTVGLGRELSDYFRRHARLADRANVMLLTGTLSVISTQALRSLGGWSALTATEDAFMGVSLIRAGYRGRYVDRVVGRGLMALDLPALKSQRARWAKGNIRTLVLTIGHELRQSRLSAHQWVGIAMQLTAWANLALPAAVLAFVSPLVWLSGHRIQGNILAALALTALVIAVLSPLLLLLPLSRSQSRNKGMRATMLAARLALQPTTAVATIEGLFPGAQRFACTPKTVTGIRAGKGRDLSICLAIAAASLLMILTAGAHLVSIAACVSAMILPMWLLAQNRSAGALAFYAGHATRIAHLKSM